MTCNYPQHDRDCECRDDGIVLADEQRERQKLKSLMQIAMAILSVGDTIDWDPARVPSSARAGLRRDIVIGFNDRQVLTRRHDLVDEAHDVGLLLRCIQEGAFSVVLGAREHLRCFCCNRQIRKSVRADTSDGFVELGSGCAERLRLAGAEGLFSVRGTKIYPLLSEHTRLGRDFDEIAD